MPECKLLCLIFQLALLVLTPDNGSSFEVHPTIEVNGSLWWCACMTCVHSVCMFDVFQSQVLHPRVPATRSRNPPFFLTALMPSLMWFPLFCSSSLIPHPSLSDLHPTILSAVLSFWLFPAPSSLSFLSFTSISFLVLSPFISFLSIYLTLSPSLLPFSAG